MRQRRLAWRLPVRTLVASVTPKLCTLGGETGYPGNYWFSRSIGKFVIKVERRIIGTSESKLACRPNSDALSRIYSNVLLYATVWRDSQGGRGVGGEQAMKRHGDGLQLRRCDCGAAHLTAREVQVLLLIAAGLGGQAIGHELGISPRTVEDHLAVMRQHAGAHDSAELVARCYAAEILLPGWPPQWSGRSCLSI